MLIAMGLPACWTQTATSTPQAVTPPPLVSPVRHEPPPLAMFERASCQVDQIVETVCGRVAGEYCPATAANVELAHPTDGLYVTTLERARATARDFVLDDHASGDFVTRLQSTNETLEGRPGCCFSRCTPLVVGTPKPLATPLPPNHARRDVCLPPPPRGTSVPEPTSPTCPQGVQIGSELRPFGGLHQEKCCYSSTHPRPLIMKGRPARVDGAPRFATVTAGDAWHAAITVELPADRDVRARLAAHWLAAARMEHASVAAFSATALRLLALGAPPALVADAHRAALDEIAHAELAFALASAYAGAPLSPAGFAAAMPLGPMTLAELAIETYVDGCVGEAVAAREAAVAADHATDPAVARA